MISLSDINRARVSRVPARALGQTPSITPPPDPDFLFTGFTGLPGFFEVITVLAVTASAAWAGISTGLSSKNRTLSTAGWVGGVGSALLGVLYLGGKSGYMPAGIPAIRVTPS